ncbi:recombinase family protein [Sphingobium baderi]|uniref:recombinase family protein n=1 Tax=Sphingobium baderi TaxID=1332080 RepID=UPI0009E98650|nr:recombinase family protein [Sphingobium baderi]
MAEQNQQPIKTADAKPAYLYARFSSLNQKEGSSIERQLTYGRTFIDKHGWDLVGELRDEGKSAFKGANREEGAALHGFELKARNGHFSSGAVLVCENVDRLSRQGAKAAAQLIWSLNEAGVDVATYHDGHIYKAGDDGDLMDLLSIIIKGALGKEESFKKSERSKANWTKVHQEIANGDKRAYSRQCPAWLDIEDDKYVLNEHRANIVRLMYGWYNDGLGCLIIMRKLNEMGEKPWSSEKRYKDRNDWTYRYIHKLLQSRAVIGEYVTLKGETLATDYYPAVVDVDTFYKAQSVRKVRASIGGDERKRSANLFLGISKCGVCGKAGVFMKRTFNDKYVKQDGTVVHYKNTRTYLKCNEARYKESPCNNPAHIRYDVIEKTVLNKALPLIASQKHEDKVLQAFDLKIAESQREIDVRQKQLDNIVEAIANGVAAKALAQKANAIEAEIETLAQQIANTKLEKDIEAAKPAKNQDVDLIAEMRSNLESEDADERFETRARINSLLSRLLRAVYINDDRTFTVEVDDGFSATYAADGTAIGYRVAGDRIVGAMDEGFLLEDKDMIIDEAFKRVRA